MATQSPPLSNPDDPFKKLLNRLVSAIARLLFTSPPIPAPQQPVPSLAPVELDVALARARERRRRLEGTVAEAGPTGVLRQEFLEVPPGAEGIEPRLFEENSAQAFAQMARLRWQLQTDETLLIERLVDAFVVFQRQAQSPRFSAINRGLAAEDPLIWLHRKKALKNTGLFPWVAVIETERPELYVEFLRPIREWFAIGVEFAPKSSPHLLATCREPGGRRGSVGGLVATPQQSRPRQAYKLTCAHVISPTCSSFVVRSFPGENDWDVPDAALFRLESACFFFDAAQSSIQEVHCVTPDFIRECMDERTSIVKSNGLHEGCTGYVHAPAHLLPAKVYGRSVRFPHLNIKPDTKTYLYGLLTLPFRRRFSKDGDSGSWALESKTGAWLGMIVAGDGYKGTWVVAAAPLLDYLRQQLAKQYGSTNNLGLTPFTYSTSNGRT